MDFLRQVFQFLLPPSLLSWQALFLVAIVFVLLTFWIFNFSIGEILVLVTANRILEQVRAVLTPPTWDSWQALVWISVFSWAVSSLAVTSAVQGIIASIAWLFLISGLHWAMHGKEVAKRLTINKLFVAPWITGGLLSIFLFGGLFDRDPSYVFVYWFPISTLIAIAPKFIKSGPKLKKPDPPVRQEIVILLLINLLFSCWFQLYFTSQYWAQRYPNLFSQKVDDRPPKLLSSTDQATRSVGVAFLEQADAGLKANLSGLPWSQVERWLINLNPNLVAISDASKLKTGADTEPWRLEGRILSGQEYAVQLWAIRRDPKTKRDRDYLTKTCTITRNPGSSLVPASQTANVQCGPVEIPTIAPSPSGQTVR